MSESKKQEQKLDKKISKAIFKYNMIEDGDKILLALSGGKDSLTLLHFLYKKQKNFKFPFTVEALHVRSEFINQSKLNMMLDLLADWDIPVKILDINVKNRLKKNQKMNCYWCSLQRRTELLNYAQKNGFTKIALGHHMDDIVETFFMNMIQKGQLSTMLPLLKLDDYKLSFIRPLCLIKEQEIIDYVESQNIQKVTCTCQMDTTSKRHEASELIKSLKNIYGTKALDQVYKSLHNPQVNYLIKESHHE
ncbi:tRNA 2-thiocytidine biosynthesis TtcA family protein [Spirochaeta cellobiosiphila]|uniref:tRNA 2-thiocytidine biosynthesis TtcA family protein n=1 Tax=Spirochaeta cellobiosiphila TaxID=504483 RepID=UPI0003F4CCCE|nr:tRNA 2-thiocytidine biosynthesis TtcA family protein [Spirochaeta cellobiosiphila]